MASTTHRHLAQVLALCGSLLANLPAVAQQPEDSSELTLRVPVKVTQMPPETVALELRCELSSQYFVSGKISGDSGFLRPTNRVIDQTVEIKLVVLRSNLKTGFTGQPAAYSCSLILAAGRNPFTGNTWPTVSGTFTL